MLSGKATDARVVWLVNKGGHDFSKLDSFGRVIPLTVGTVNPFNPDRLMLNLAHHLALAKADDYLAISGLPILNGLALSMWLMKFPVVNVLQYSVRGNEYVYLAISRAAMEQNIKGD